MSEIHHISTSLVGLSVIKDIVDNQKQLALSKEAINNINNSYRFLSKKIKNNDTPIYGINTGFGSLCNVKISSENLSKLQENLVTSHACGTGEYVPKAIVKLMLLLKIQSLSYGYSGVQLVTVARLVAMYNANVIPVVYTQGSLGASGDLSPLAHLSLPLLGKGDVWLEDTIVPTSSIMQHHNWSPITSAR